jgi:hypothetical protein
VIIASRPTSRAASWFAALSIFAFVLLGFAPSASATDQILFPAVDNAIDAIVARINAETVRIDISAWYLTEHAISIAIANRFAAGVPVRLIGDRGSIFEIDPNTKNEFYWLANQGVPIRLRFNPTWFPEIDHWKMGIFVGQNVVEFGSANWTTFELAPASSTNYDDETALFTDDPVLVNAFKTKFDQMWNDTTAEPQSVAGGPPYLKNWADACANEPRGCDFLTQYPNPAPMVINTARLEPDNPTPPDLIWGQGPSFNNRLVQEITNEPASLQFVIYRLTVDNITQALLSRWRAGVQMQLFVEPGEYLNRTWPEFWLTHANFDKLWAAGIPIRQRVHQGLTHMKTLVTAAYATNASSNYAAGWQRDHDYFVSSATKPSIYTAIKNRVTAMWNDANAFAPFQPQPPDAPAIVSPGPGATGVPMNTSLVWNIAAFATDYDVYLGTSPSNMTRVANVPAQLVNNLPTTYSWTPSRPLCTGTTYYWLVVSRTNATPVNPAISAGSSTQSFTTVGAHSSCSSRPGDFYGNGRADTSVFRPSNATWYIRDQATGTTSNFQWGNGADVPVPGDYDGDGKADIAVFRPSNGTWYVVRSSDGTGFAAQWGIGSDIPVPGDYDGDGKTDLAVFRPSNATWYIIRSSDASVMTTQWGNGADIPVPGDYDGDGKTDIAVFRPSIGIWYIVLSGGDTSLHNGAVRRIRQSPATTTATARPTSPSSAPRSVRGTTSPHTAAPTSGSNGEPDRMCLCPVTTTGTERQTSQCSGRRRVSGFCGTRAQGVLRHFIGEPETTFRSSSALETDGSTGGESLPWVGRPRSKPTVYGSSSDQPVKSQPPGHTTMPRAARSAANAGALRSKFALASVLDPFPSPAPRPTASAGPTHGCILTSGVRTR